MFLRATVNVLEVLTSDHMPLFLDFKRMVYAPKSKKLRFENVWIKEE